MKVTTVLQNKHLYLKTWLYKGSQNGGGGIYFSFDEV